MSSFSRNAQNSKIHFWNVLKKSSSKKSLLKRTSSSRAVFLQNKSSKGRSLEGGNISKGTLTKMKFIPKKVTKGSFLSKGVLPFKVVLNRRSKKGSYSLNEKDWKIKSFIIRSLWEENIFLQNVSKSFRGIIFEKSSKERILF